MSLRLLGAFPFLALPLAWSCFFLSSALGAPSRTFSVMDFGAAGDGKTLDTAAINHAVVAASTAPGGQVLFPAGRYLSGTIELRSGVTLFFDAGSVLIGATNLDAYQHFAPPAGTPESKFRPEWHRALLLADGAEQVTLCGPGTIDGNQVYDPRGEERMRGPHTIILGNSRQITIRDLTIRDSANYAVMLEDCDDVEIRNIRVTGGWDGIHFRGWPDRPCRNVSIVRCEFYTGDDSIAGRYWENVLISDCIINSSCNGIRLIGPATHLIIQNCLFYGPGVYPHRTSNRYNMLAAVNLQPGAWDATEGLLDDVLISDLTIHNVTTPFHFSLKPGNTAGTIAVNRINATGVYRAPASIESWAAAPITNVVFRDVTIEFAGGGTTNTAKFPVKSPGVDARALPVWGFYARNVGRLNLDNVRLRLTRDDLRPVLAAEGVQELVVQDFSYPTLAAVPDPMLLTNVVKYRVVTP